METCILIPNEFGLVLTLHPNPKNVMEMFVDIWSNDHIPSGTVFRPDQGTIRLDRLEVYSRLPKDDVRYRFGCYDEILEVAEREVRHCNWIRFVKSTSNTDQANLVAVMIKNEPVFQTIKEIKPNDEIKVLFDVSTERVKPEAEVVEREVPEQEKSPEIENKHESMHMLSPDSIGHRGLFTSPLAREDDCRSNLSDVTSGSEESDKLEQVKSESDVTTESSPEFISGSERPIKRNRERTWLPCEVCGKKFDRPSLLKRHMRTHTGEKPHACDVCGKAFSTSSSLNTHRRIHSGEKPHQCKVCGKRFTASSNLYYHRMTHNKEKPHKCTLCSKSFPTPGDLRSHMYVHNGSWPFKCDVCNRGFSKQTNLKNHLLLHTGDKPHECPSCGKKFALQCNLKTHLKTHENDLQEECSQCGRMFITSSVSPNRNSCQQCTNKPTDNAKQNKLKRNSDFSISRLTESTPKRQSQPSPRSLIDDFHRDPVTSPQYERSPPFYSPRLTSHPVHSALSPISPPNVLVPSRLHPGFTPLSTRQTSHMISPSNDHMKHMYAYPCSQFPVDSRIFGSDAIAQRQNSYWSNVLAHGY